MGILAIRPRTWFIAGTVAAAVQAGLALLNAIVVFMLLDGQPLALYALIVVGAVHAVFGFLSFFTMVVCFTMGLVALGTGEAAARRRAAPAAPTTVPVPPPRALSQTQRQILHLGLGLLAFGLLLVPGPIGHILSEALLQNASLETYDRFSMVPIIAGIVCVVAGFASMVWATVTPRPAPLFPPTGREGPGADAPSPPDHR